MRKLLLAILCASTLSAGATKVEDIILKGRQANEDIQGTSVIRYKSFSSIPAYIQFQENKQIAFSEWQDWVINRYFKDNNNISFELIADEHDQLGMEHFRFQQKSQGFPVEFGIWIVHVKDGMVVSMNGELFDQIEEFSPSLNETAALNQALAEVGADSYKWEIQAEEDAIKSIKHDQSATYYPSGELVIINSDPSLSYVDLKLSWKFNVYAHEPMSRHEVYVDATNGSTVFMQDLIHHADSNGTAVTNYNGNFNLVADYTGSNFRLRETGRGNGVSTYNLNSATTGLGSDFFDIDNVWNSTAANEMSGPDAHYGAEMTYDFYFENFGRNSIDDNGFELISRVNYGNNFNNAFWNGDYMTYGSGGASYATMDVSGHEVSHGLTSNTAALIYSYESGALNESFSDIFGSAIEFFAEGGISDWTMGEDRGSIIRYMHNPNLGGDPDTYLGDYWHTAAWDNGGVHINSGVQNFWFYLLTTGGIGTNDNGDSYNVGAIGVEDAQAVAFRNLTVYLTTTSQFADARFYAIQSAIDLFGTCSDQLESTTNAWYAVGVGDEYTEEVFADFDASNSEICRLPFTVAFSNFSTNADTYAWDFGDGNNSTMASPTHTFTEEGTFTIELDASSDCGEDQTSASISIDLPDAPSAETADICPGDSAVFIASNSANGTNVWFADATSTTPIYEGDTFVSPSLNQNTIYYVSTITEGNIEDVGPADNNIGSGAYFTNYQSLIFDVFSASTLKSVKVYSNQEGEREIELMDANGTVLATKTVDIPEGEHIVDLDFELPAGTGFSLGLVDGSQIDLFRNNGGVNYPYDIQGVLSITNSTANQNGGLNHYYFFYDWKVSEGDCESSKTEVLASMNICLGVDELLNNNVSIFPNPNTGQFNVTWDNFTVNNLSIVNMHGQLVEQLVPTSNQVNLSLSAGVYFVSLAGDEGNVIKRVIVQ